MTVSIPGIGLTIVDIQTGAAGVTSINGLSGTPVITSPDGSITVNVSGTNIEIKTSGASGSGTVTKVSAGGLLTASTNPITVAGDISIAPAPANTILSNNASALAQPIWNSTLVLGMNGYANTPNSNAMQITGSANSFYQISIQNLSSAVNLSSADFIATADDGSDTTHYVDFGINGSHGGSNAFTNPHAGYVYSTDSEMNIGALGTNGVVNIWAGGGVLTPVTAGSLSAILAQFPGDISAPIGRITASAATFTGKITGQAASFSALVSADGGINTQTVSAASVNVTGDIRAATGRIVASAATISGLFSGTTASFSGKVSADAGLNTTTVSAASIGVTGDINASTGKVLASAATFTGKLTGQAASFSAIVSAHGGLNTTVVSAASIDVTGDINAAAGRVLASAATISGLLAGATANFSGTVSAASLNVTGDMLAATGRVAASAATISGLLTGATASFSGIVSANAGIKSTTGGFSGLLNGTTASFSGKVSADAGLNTTTVSAASIGITGDLNAATGRVIASAGTFSGIVSALNFVTAVVSVAYNGTTTVDASQGSYFRGVAVSAFTLSANNSYDGQKIIWEIIQDATGSRVMTLGSNFALGTDITAATLTATANKRDFLGAFNNSATGKLYVTAFVRGY